jgi:hypothetical protein
MSLFIIATVVSQMGNRWNTLGYKVLNTTTGQCKLLSENSIRNNKLVIENGEFVNGELKATMGDFKRYTKLNASDGRPVGGRTLVILGKDSEGYMLCVEYPESDSDLIRRMSPAELKRQIKFYTGNMDGVKVANARVDNPDNVKEMIIRPIKGNFNVIKECPKYLENEFYFGKKQNGFSQNWKVRIIKKGMPFGNNPNKINEGNTIIEFYDISGDREKFPAGQYVCSYYLTSILEHKGTLSLYADVNAWTILGTNLEEIKEWAMDI